MPLSKTAFIYIYIFVDCCKCVLLFRVLHIFHFIVGIRFAIDHGKQVVIVPVLRVW